ncbi:MAG: peptide deformylase [Spirochaetota bacterium]
MLKILKLGDDLLKKQSVLIPDIDRGIQALVEAMFETMYNGKGIGLAASQVGELKRLFICHVSNDSPRVFINPEIIGTAQGQVLYEEGCLSIPNTYGDVLRPESVTVQAWNAAGKPFTLNTEGMLARVILHEFDHLNGILFIDHLNEKKKLRILKSFTGKIKL